MNRRIFIFFFLLLSFRLAAQQEPMSLNLKDAEKRFQEHNLSLIAEHYNIDMAHVTANTHISFINQSKSQVAH